MTKRPTPPRELTEAFRREAVLRANKAGLNPCRLAAHDSFFRPCSGHIEAFHFIGRQQIRNALYGMGLGQGKVDAAEFVNELIELAEWDPRNAGAACVEHHRRLDNHATPDLTMPYGALPERVIEFANDWGLELALEGRYPQ